MHIDAILVLDIVNGRCSDYWTLFTKLGWIQQGCLQRLLSLRGGRRYVVGFLSFLILDHGGMNRLQQKYPQLSHQVVAKWSDAHSLKGLCGLWHPCTTHCKHSLIIVLSSMFASDLRCVLYAFLYHSPFHSPMCPCVGGIAALTIGSILNYFLLGLALQIPSRSSSRTVVFPSIGNLGSTYTAGASTQAEELLCLA